MDRRKFLQFSAAGFFGLSVGSKLEAFSPKCRKGSSYSVVILGDTHYDKQEGTTYHDGYTDPNPKREANHRKEFVRNSNMWKERIPKILKRAGCLVDDNTKLALQMGDLIQGDTGYKQNHIQMLSDAFECIKTALGPVPLVTVMGNHDSRGTSDAVAREAYVEYMPARIGKELGQSFDGPNFAFNIGEDAFIVIDFNQPDDATVEKLLKQTEGARYTFVIMHCPVFPYDDVKYYNWFYHSRTDKTPDNRRKFNELFASRNVIVLCGHTHSTEFMDWKSDAGRITQMTMTSVWSKEELGNYNIDAEGAEQYGAICAAAAAKKGEPMPQAQKDLFDEFRPGIQKYVHADSCGCYRLNVSDKGVSVDFFAGDSTRPTAKYILR